MEREPDRIGTIAWTSLRVSILGALVVFHAGLVFRFRIARLFSPEWLGYAAIGLAFVLLSAFILRRCCLARPEPAAPGGGPAGSRIIRPVLIAAALLIILAGLIWRYQVYAGTRIHAGMGDMLPLILEANAALLAGEFPYRVYELPWKVPLTYLPGLWMAYLPAAAVAFDPRHIGLACTAGTMLLLLAAAADREARLDPLAAGLVVIACFCLSPAIARFSINGHTYPYWLFLSAFAFCLARGRVLTAALCFGLVLAARQTSVVYLPFFAVFLWRAGGRRAAAAGLLAAGVVCGALCLPYAAIDARAFLLDPMGAYTSMAAWDFGRGEQSFAAKTIGLAFGVKSLGLLEDLGWVRYGFLALLPPLAWYCGKDARTALASMGAAGIIFAAIAPVSWYYIYVPPILILSFAVLAEPGGPGGAERSRAAPATSRSPR